MRDVHSDRNDCSLCTESFSSKRNLKQQMQNVHKTQEQIIFCCNWGKILSKKETLLSHERRCTSTEMWRKKLETVVHCKYCNKKFTTRFNAKQHEKEKHVRERSPGNMLNIFDLI